VAQLVVRGGNIIDGTGSPPFEADLVIDDGRVTFVGNASEVKDARTVDARGRIVCPGFIDIHNHSDFPLYVDGLAQSGIRQGLTTLVTGNCGHGPAPAPDRELAKQVTVGINDEWGIDFAWNTFGEYLDSLLSKGQSLNVAPLVPHGTVRLAAMGFDTRKPTRREMENMKSFVADAMSAGAVGMSTGLEYSPGRHADVEELIELSKVAARHGGIYASHIRERGDRFEDAVEEALSIAEQAGIHAQLSHLAPRPYAPVGSFDRVLSRIVSSRQAGLSIGIDTFPDPWGPAHLLDLVPPWVYEGADEDVLVRLENPKTAEDCRPYFANPTNFLLRLGGFDKLYLTHSEANRDLVGESLDAIAGRWGLDPIRTILRLAAADEKDYAGVMIRHNFATEEDLDRLLLEPICSVGSDGAVASKDGILASLVMNRSSYGYAPRFIREYALDRGLFTAQEAIRKMTSLPAESVQLTDRGTLKPGMAADVVIMDFETLADNSTDDEPQAYPTGVDAVVVNGELVFENGAHTGRTPGRVLSS